MKTYREKSFLRSWKWLGIISLLVAVFVVSFFQMERSGFFNIQDVQVSIVSTESQKPYAKAYIDNVSDKLNKFKGISLIRISTSDISSFLKTQKWIKDYRISREWPSKLSVTIEPQRISLIYVSTKSLSEALVTPVADSGELLPTVDTRFAPAVSILKGEVFKKDLAKRKKAIELVNSLPSNGKLNSNNLSEINYDSRDGYWIQVIDSNLKIKLGEDQFMLKSARVSQVMDYLEKKDLKARVIDANLSKKVLVRLRQTP